MTAQVDPFRSTVVTLFLLRLCAEFWLIFTIFDGVPCYLQCVGYLFLASRLDPLIKIEYKCALK